MERTQFTYSRESFLAPSGVTYSYLICDGRRRVTGSVPAEDHLPPILAIHGLGFNASYWFPLMRSLYGKCNFVAVDLPSSGMSSSVAVGDISLNSISQDLASLMQSLFFARYFIVGQGFGGLVSLQMGANYPENIVKMVVCSTNPQPLPTPDPDYAFPYNIVLQRLLATVSTLPETEICDTARTLASILDSEDTSPETSLANQYANSLGQFQFYTALLPSVNIRDILPSVAAPVLIVSGTDDLSVPMGASGVLRENIPNSALVEIYGAGTNIPIRRTLQFNDLVQNFLLCGYTICQSELILNRLFSPVNCLEIPAAADLFAAPCHKPHHKPCSAPEDECDVSDEEDDVPAPIPRRVVIRPRYVN